MGAWSLSLVTFLAITIGVWLFVSHTHSEKVVQSEQSIEREGGDKKGRVSGVFVYLVTAAKSVDAAPSDSHPVWDYAADLVVSLRYLEKNFNHQHGYPVIIFHDGLSKEDLDYIREASGSISPLLSFEQIYFDFPESIRSLPETEKTKLNGFTCTNKPWHIDYLHMNRFFTLNMYLHPALAPYEYYIRLDTDLFVKERVPFDFFRRMKEEDVTFAYWNEHHEPDGCVHGLQGAAMQYMKERNLRVFNIDPSKAYHGCFGAGKVAFFRSPSYLDFARYLNELGGIYFHRWADQVIYRMALEIFGEKSKGTVHRWQDLGQYVMHNKHFPSDLCDVVPFHHKCEVDKNGRSVLTSSNLKLEPRHAGAFSRVFFERKDKRESSSQEGRVEL